MICAAFLTTAVQLSRKYEEPSTADALDSKQANAGSYHSLFSSPLYPDY